MKRKYKIGLLIACLVLMIVCGATMFLFAPNTGYPPGTENQPNMEDRPKTEDGDTGGELAGIITAAQYEEIARNMTYEKVAEILGCAGTLQSETGERGSPDHIAVYIWQGEIKGSSAVFTFHGNLMASKTHLGLS